VIPTHTNESALLVQERLAEINSESAVIPILTGLPEGVTQQAFEKYYQEITSTNYISMLSHIDAQLLKNPYIKFNAF